MGKRLSPNGDAVKQAQARDNQSRDIANATLTAPVFENRIATSLGESLTVLAPIDRWRQYNRDQRSIRTTMSCEAEAVSSSSGPRARATAFPVRATIALPTRSMMAFS